MSDFALPAMSTTSNPFLPPDDDLRATLHNEVHVRPPARIRLPALVVYVAVLNHGVSRDQEHDHLRRLPGHEALEAWRLAGNFVRLALPDAVLKWERHSEFTRYTLVQPLPAAPLGQSASPELTPHLMVPTGWLAGIPGRTIAAIELVMLTGDLHDAEAGLVRARDWLGERWVVASVLGNQHHSMVATDFRLRDGGFERMLVIAQPDTTETRAGRISQRLVELETYRLMALRGLPVAKALAPELAAAERQLADITAQLEGKAASDAQLLDTLVALAARVERATAEHAYRFAATRAYDTLVGQRIAELREHPIPGTQTIGEFMQRRLSPAMATVAATAQRLTSLSERVARTSDLLRTRVDIATEQQNQQLLEKLTRGQELQLRLQSTVEGLSIAAISYYMVSLLLYGGKALKGAGVPINPEIAAGALIPLVLWAVWRTTRRIHARLHSTP